MRFSASRFFAIGGQGGGLAFFSSFRSPFAPFFFALFDAKAGIFVWCAFGDKMKKPGKHIDKQSGICYDAIG